MTNIDLFTCANGETRCWSSYSIITNELIRGCSSANLTETGCVTDNQNGMICRKSKVIAHESSLLDRYDSVHITEDYWDSNLVKDGLTAENCPRIANFILIQIWLRYKWVQHSSIRWTLDQYRVKCFEFKLNRKGPYKAIIVYLTYKIPIWTEVTQHHTCHRYNDCVDGIFHFHQCLILMNWGYFKLFF